MLARDKCLEIFQHVVSSLINRVYRYFNQININISQLYVKNDNYDSAIETLLEAESISNTYASNYQSELSAELAYLYYLNNDYQNAIITSNSALIQAKYLGQISTIRRMRQILIGSSFKLNYYDFCNDVLHLLDSDKLGLVISDIRI